jgi:putative tryptophan/tyrosine transport system substrate-binding protein
MPWSEPWGLAMRRRDFVKGIAGSAIGWPSAARAQEPGRIYRVALIVPVGRDEPAIIAFLDELRSQGFVEGQNLIVVPGFRATNEQVDTIVPATIQAAPDVIATGGDLITRAFQKSTQSIPLVVITEDLVAAGFVASLARPGANITGISLMSPELDGKRQDILIEAVPGAHRIAALVDSNISTLQHLKTLEQSARMQGKELFVIRAAHAGDLKGAVSDAVAHGASALNVLGSAMLHLNRRVIMDQATALRLPAIFQWPETAEEGGLLGYGPGFVELFRQRAAMVAKILRGTKPSDLPVEQPSTFKLVVNLKSAKAIGLTIPESFLARADEVIE